MNRARYMFIFIAVSGESWDVFMNVHDMFTSYSYTTKIGEGLTLVAGARWSVESAAAARYKVKYFSK